MIAFNVGAGVDLTNRGDIFNNAIRENSIYRLTLGWRHNGLGNSGIPNTNDLLDSDTGPNTLPRTATLLTPVVLAQDHGNGTIHRQLQRHGRSHGRSRAFFGCQRTADPSMDMAGRASIPLVLFLT